VTVFDLSRGDFCAIKTLSAVFLRSPPIAPLTYA
jgi:hypothetical protein